MKPWKLWWTMPVLIFAGITGAGLARADVNSAVRQYAEWNHEKICVTAGLTGIDETVARVFSDSLFLTRTESAQAVHVSILQWCPQHLNVWNTYQHRTNRWMLR